MEAYSVAELGRNASKFCSSKEPFVVTVNGRAQNLVLNVAGLGIDEIVDLSRASSGLAAMARLQKQAEKSGAASLTDSEIETEIDAVRCSR